MITTNNIISRVIYERGKCNCNNNNSMEVLRGIYLHKSQFYISHIQTTTTNNKQT